MELALVWSMVCNKRHRDLYDKRKSSWGHSASSLWFGIWSRHIKLVWHQSPKLKTYVRLCHWCLSVSSIDGSKVTSCFRSRAWFKSQIGGKQLVYSFTDLIYRWISERIRSFFFSLCWMNISSEPMTRSARSTHATRPIRSACPTWLNST